MVHLLNGLLKYCTIQQIKHVNIYGRDFAGNMSGDGRLMANGNYWGLMGIYLLPINPYWGINGDYWGLTEDLKYPRIPINAQ